MARRSASLQRRKAVINAFDAAHPVERRSDLLDRDDKLEILFDAVIDRQQHAVIHGPRGSGKTSLVRVFGDYADQQGAIVIYLLCEPTSDFATLLAPYMDFVPDYALTTRSNLRESLSSPRALTSFLAESMTSQVVFIFDEFDRITDRALQDEMATFMKLLSDARVPAQLVLVGIASSVDLLIDSHLSLRRHLTAVDVGRLSDAGTREIIEHGAQLSQIDFDDDARDLIVQASCGSPYHVRIFAQSACMAMLRGGADRVDLDAAYGGLSIAVNAWGALNKDDFALFSHLCATSAPGERAQLCKIATLGVGGSVLANVAGGPAQAAGAELLGDSVIRDADALGKLIFRDSLAPQFLIAMLLLAEKNDRQALPINRQANPSKV